MREKIGNQTKRKKGIRILIKGRMKENGVGKVLFDSLKTGRLRLHTL